VADIKNTGGRNAGASTAAAFLAAFVGETPWVHLDIAGTAWTTTPLCGYQPRGATGVGVRMLLELLRHWDGSALAGATAPPNFRAHSTREDPDPMSRHSLLVSALVLAIAPSARSPPTSRRAKRRSRCTARRATARRKGRRPGRQGLQPPPRDFTKGEFKFDAEQERQGRRGRRPQARDQEGPGAFGGAAFMPAWEGAIADADIENVIAVIRSLKRSSRRRARRTLRPPTGGGCYVRDSDGRRLARRSQPSRPRACRSPLRARIARSGPRMRSPPTWRSCASIRRSRARRSTSSRCRWVEHGDREAARRLALANLRLVVKIAMEYRRAWTNVLDLIQDGNVGLLEAVQRYDPYQGVKLSTYAVYWIRAYILQYILDNFRIVRLGTTRAQRKLFWRLNKEKRELERQGFEVEPRLIAERLDVSEAEVEDMDMRLRESDLSMNMPARRDEPGAAESATSCAPRASAEENVADQELRRVFLEKVQEFAKTLDERDRILVDRRILADEPATLAELGDEFGVSRERVRQLEVRIVERPARVPEGEHGRLRVLRRAER
jgi:alternative sigma factor RpoH